MEISRFLVFENIRKKIVWKENQLFSNILPHEREEYCPRTRSSDFPALLRERQVHVV